MVEVTRIDLVNDWLVLIKQELIDNGHDMTGLSDEKISILYFSLQKRLISQTPRSVKKSNVFNCPPNLDLGLELLERKIQEGDDLNPYLTRKIKNIYDGDGLLYDWGIFHLHLGIKVEEDGFIERTGPLLYAKFDRENAYLIGVYSHGKWTMQELIRIIHDNWPESIKNYRLDGVMGLEIPITEMDRKHLRNACWNVPIELEPGVVYIGPGDGFAASGDSVEAVEKSMDTFSFLTDLQTEIKENPELFINSTFGRTDLIRNNSLEFEMIKKDGRGNLIVYEKNNRFQFELKNNWA